VSLTGVSTLINGAGTKELSGRYDSTSRPDDKGCQRPTNWSRIGEIIPKGCSTADRDGRDS
jgi:hypothetical protein